MNCNTGFGFGAKFVEPESVEGRTASAIIIYISTGNGTTSLLMNIVWYIFGEFE